MNLKKISIALVIIIGGTILVNQLVHLVWHVISEHKLSKADHAEHSQVQRAVLWRDPGSVATLDFKTGAGGFKSVPKAPFKFLQENMAGSSPSVFVKDQSGRRWRVKWGEEVRSETFTSRVVWAAGYFSDVDYFIPEGIITEPENLQRAKGWIDKNNHFNNARFELDDPQTEKLFDEHSWAWNDNPFLGTHELAGLKILVMFVSNWDNKDKHDASRGSNTAVFLQPLHSNAIEAQYLICDWGASMGKWGENILVRRKWDAQGYFDQTPDFVRGISKGFIEWGYKGQRTEEIAQGITVEDVQWFIQYLGQFTDDQLRNGLRSCGANEMEISLFVPAMRDRINQLRNIAMGKPNK